MENELGIQTMGAPLCLQPGEVHLRDLKQQTSLEGLDADQTFRVLALGKDGVPVELDLGLAPKWSTRGWELQVACPLCSEPSRVLRQRNGVFCCARCAPRSTPHHRFKSCRYWTRDGGRT